jgi:hypothetical protein
MGRPDRRFRFSIFGRKVGSPFPFWMELHFWKSIFGNFGTGKISVPVKISADPGKNMYREISCLNL